MRRRILLITSVVLANIALALPASAEYVFYR